MILLVRRWACRVADHHRNLALAASVAGMVGFVLSTGPVRWWGRSEVTVLLGSLASLGVYGFALGVGHLGDPWELARLELRARAPALRRRPTKMGARARRRSTSLPSRSWT